MGSGSESFRTTEAYMVINQLGVGQNIMLAIHLYNEALNGCIFELYVDEYIF